MYMQCICICNVQMSKFTKKCPHPRSGGSQGQETILALSADKQTHNYYTVLKPPSLPITIR